MIKKLKAILFIFFMIVLFSFGATYISQAMYLQGNWISKIHDAIQNLLQFLGIAADKADRFAVYTILLLFVIVIAFIYRLGIYIFSKTERE